jgi:hypothetical protein
VNFDLLVVEEASISWAMALIKGPDMYTLGVAFFAAIGTFLFGEYWHLGVLPSPSNTDNNQASTLVSRQRLSLTKAG